MDKFCKCFLCQVRLIFDLPFQQPPPHHSVQGVLSVRMVHEICKDFVGNPGFVREAKVAFQNRFPFRGVGDATGVP